MRTIDLFCGCGDMSLGFQNAGYQIVGAFDLWEAALNCYNSNFAHKATALDLSKKNIALRIIWLTIIDKVNVHHNGRMTFKFQGGTESDT